MFDEAKARLMEIRYAAPEMVARRQTVLAALAVRPGERALDVGCGPGFVVADLAERVGPSGFVAAIDNSPEMVRFARERLTRLGISNVEIQGGEATELPFNDAFFDVYTATQVLEYVPKIEQALAETFRVLRPGGRLALVDADWATWNWHLDDEALGRRLMAAWAAHCAHHHLPRYLAPLLRQAGFAVGEVSILPILDLDGRTGTFSQTLVESMATFLRKTEAIPEREITAWLADIERQVEQGTYFFSANQYLFIAHHPD